MSQGLEDPQVAFAAEALADLLGSHTERLGEARSLLQKALEVSMVSVTLLCCHVPLASPCGLRGSWNCIRGRLSFELLHCLVLVSGA